MVEPWYEHWSCSGWGKGTSQDKATLNSEEIKPIVLAVSYAYLKASGSQSVLKKKKFFKFHINFMKRFRVGLNTFLGLAMPNHAAKLSKSKSGGLLGGIFGQETPNLIDPYIKKEWPRILFLQVPHLLINEKSICQ